MGVPKGQSNDKGSPFSAFFLSLTLLALKFTGTSGSPEAKRLYDDLLKKSGYNKLIRPVGNTTDTLTVKLGLRLTQIIDVVSVELIRITDVYFVNIALFMVYEILKMWI